MEDGICRLRGGERGAEGEEGAEGTREQGREDALSIDELLAETAGTAMDASIN